MKSKIIPLIVIIAFFAMMTAPVLASAADSATYSYDDLGRVYLVTYANGTQVGYGYDSEGNRYAIAVVCSGTGC
jgi:YD repeat-containing protein